MYFICSEIAINNDFNIRFRNHPKNKFKILKSIEILEIYRYDNNNSLIQDFNWSDLVITINSTTGLETILNKKPLILVILFIQNFLRSVDINIGKTIFLFLSRLFK